MSTIVFDRIPLSFHHQGILIDGILMGSLTYWEFNSNHPSFLKFFPSGSISSKTTIKYPTEEYDSFINDFYKSADLLVL